MAAGADDKNFPIKRPLANGLSSFLLTILSLYGVQSEINVCIQFVDLIDFYFIF